MYTRRKIAFPVVVRFAWRNVIFFVLWSVAMTLLHTYLNKSGLHFGIPFAPLSTIGIAVAFYMGFKNSQSYDRLWEARKIWGAIVNLSRSWASMVISTVDLDVNKAPIPTNN